MENQVLTQIPVKDGQDLRYAVIYQNDKPLIDSISGAWRLSSTGYVLAVKRVNGKIETSYMHKILAGGPAKHINGDRLDNRRSNLLLLRNDGAMADIEVIEAEDSSSCTNIPLPSFVGELKDGQPHGYGLLATQLETHTTHEIGIWEHGKLMKGVQVIYPITCNCEDKSVSPLLCINRHIITLNMIN